MVFLRITPFIGFYRHVCVCVCVCARARVCVVHGVVGGGARRGCALWKVEGRVTCCECDCVPLK